MAGLRAEYVKEALRWVIVEPDGVVYQPANQGHQALIVAAAREWLAAQEQTPDYEAALVELEAWASEVEGRRSSRDAVRTIVDAALVGFHPQDEGDER